MGYRINIQTSVHLALGRTQTTNSLVSIRWWFWTAKFRVKISMVAKWNERTRKGKTDKMLNASLIVIILASSLVHRQLCLQTALCSFLKKNKTVVCWASLWFRSGWYSKLPILMYIMYMVQKKRNRPDWCLSNYVFQWQVCFFVCLFFMWWIVLN